MTVQSHNRQRKKSINKRWLEKALDKIIRETGIDDSKSEINVVFVGDRYIRELNKRYLKRNYPADIMTFTYSKRRNSVTGDIFISIPRTLDQAKRYRHGFYHELSLLLTHGFLHLIGYEHQNPRQEKSMKSKTRKIMSRILNK